jgi:hypothetical protein
MDFPSGPWTGFYNYGSTTRKHRMDLVLAFADNMISGDGSDDIGQFVVTGRFDEANRECYWTKTYIGAHSVYYRGFAKAKGFGDYGNCRANQAAFKFGHSEKRKVNAITTVPKSQRH